MAGGGIAALALFLMLVVGGMRHEAREELERLRVAGARSHQLAAFVVADCAMTCGAALLVGAAAAVAAAAILAGGAHEPIERHPVPQPADLAGPGRSGRRPAW